MVGESFSDLEKMNLFIKRMFGLLRSLDEKRSTFSLNFYCNFKIPRVKRTL